MSKILSDTRLRRAATLVVGLALLAVVGVPAVGAGSLAPVSSGAAPAATADPSLERLLGRHPLLAGTVRADLTVVKRDGSSVLVHYEAGTISAVGSTSISITGRDGKGATFTVTAGTRVRRDGHAVSISVLKVGDRARVFGTGTAGSYTALLIRSPQARPAS